MFELISKKQAAISNAIDARVSYTDVAELLESASNIQLEVAKRLIAKNPKQTEIKQPSPVDPVVLVHKEPKGDLYEELYRLKLELKKKRMKKKRVVSKRQLGFDFG